MNTVTINPCKKSPQHVVKTCITKMGVTEYFLCFCEDCKYGESSTIGMIDSIKNWNHMNPIEPPPSKNDTLKLEIDLITQSPDKQFLIDNTKEFVLQAMAKFQRGYEEHGGSIMDRKLLDEIDNEIIDIHHYSKALRSKIGNIVLYINNLKQAEELTNRETIILNKIIKQLLSL